MLMGLFLWPGRLAARLFSSDRKKDYRSRRPRAEASGRLALLSLVLWLAGAGALLFALDRTGLLKEALDAGVEAAQGERTAAPLPAPEPAPPEPDAPTAGGALTQAAPEPAKPEPIAAPASPAAPETEMWLVILHSIPKTGRPEAERRQAGYKTRGLEVDILDTNAFPKLPPNYWVIALGPFDSRAEALTAADRAKAFNSGLMVRRGL
jgi:cell division septation protein DedD